MERKIKTQKNALKGLKKATSFCFLLLGCFLVFWGFFEKNLSKNQKSATGADLLARHNIVRNPGLSSTDDDSLFKKYVNYDNYRGVEAGGFAPPGPWMISRSQHYAAPTLTGSYQEEIKNANNGFLGKITNFFSRFIDINTAHAAITKQINYQGKLTNSDSWAVSDGSYDMRFKIYDAVTDGTLLWTGTHTAANGNAVTVANGIFSVLLGSGTGNDLTLDFSGSSGYFLQVEIYNSETPAWETFSPRKSMVSVPQAVNANNVIGDGRIDIAYTDNTNTALKVTQSGTGDIVNILDGASEVFTILDGGNVGVNSAAPDRRFEVLDTDNPQLRLTHTDNSVYAEMQADSSGYLYINATGNRVGIEDSTPSYTLDVGGTLGSTGNYTITKADPSIVLDVTTATDTDFWLGVTDDGGGDDDDLFQIGDGTTPGTNPFVTIDTSGNVGIKTTTMGQDLNIQDTTSGIELTGSTTSGSANTAQIIFEESSSNIWNINKRSSGWTGGRANNFEISYYDTTWHDFFAIQSSGDVGIGVTNPIAKLHVSDGNSPASSLYTTDYQVISAQSTAPGFNIIASSDTSSHRGVFKATRSRGTLASPTAVATNDQVLSILGAAFDGTTQRASAGINFVVDGTVVNNSQAPQAITFETGTASRTEIARITSGGKFLVNTTSSQSDFGAPLEVRTSTDWAGPLIYQTANNTTGTVYNSLKGRSTGAAAVDDWIGGIQFNIIDSSSAAQNVAAIHAKTTNVTNGSEQGNIYFYTRNGSTWGDRMIIDYNGNVQVQDGRLQVTGDSTPLSGKGVELGFVSGTGKGVLLSYDRDTSAMEEMRYNALQHEFEISSVPVMTLEATTGDLLLVAGTEIKMKESTGDTYYGIIEVGDLGSADATYTFSGVSGTVVTSNNYTSYLAHDSITGSGTVDTAVEVQGVSVGGDASGTVGSITVTDDSHSHTSATLPVATSYLGSAIESTEITDDEILEIDLKASNSAGNGQLLSYNSSTGGFTWTDPGGVTDIWVDEAGDTMSGSLIFSGVATDITSVSNQDIVISPNGTGKVGVLTASPNEALEVTGNIRTSGVYKIGTQQILTLGSGSLDGNIIVGDGGGSLSHTVDLEGYYNTFIGLQAGNASTVSYGNFFGGYQAGYANTTGSTNTFVGAGAGLSNVGGSGSVFVGYAAGYNDTGVGSNTFIGESAGNNNTSGIENTTLGRDTAYYNQTGSYNTVLGTFAGLGVTGNSYSNNTFIGSSAGRSATTGGNNVALGYQAGYSNATGAGNVFLGYQAGYSETGSSKLYVDNSNTTSPLIYGDFSTNLITINGDLAVADAEEYFIGSTQVLSKGNGSYASNLIVGDGGGSLTHASGDEGYYNTAVGIGALSATTSGAYNNAMGYGALNANTSGNFNSAFGPYALLNNTIGYSNNAFGAGALISNTEGIANIAIGDSTLYYNTVGDENIGLGYATLYNVLGDGNVAVGSSAGYTTTGSGNIFLGYQAGYNETGSEKLYIDNSSTTSPLIYGDFSSDSLTVNGNLGVGINPTSNTKLYVSSSLTGDANNYGIYNNTVVTQTLGANRNSGAIFNGITYRPTEGVYDGQGRAAYNYAATDGAYTYNYLIGSYNFGYSTSTASSGQDAIVGSYNTGQISSTGTVTSVYGSRNLAYENSSATVTSLIGADAVANRLGTGTISGAYGLSAVVSNSDTTGTGTITTAYGVKSAIQKDASANNITTGYLFHGTISGAATAWGLYLTGETKSYFSGNVGIGTETPGARLTIGAGTSGADPSPSIVLGDYYDNSGNPSLSHLQLYTGYGFGVSGNTLNYISGQDHKFYDKDDLTTPLLTVNTNKRLGIGLASPTWDLSFDGESQKVVGVERRTTSDSAGSNLVIRTGGATVGATNKNGGTLYLDSGIATGTGSSNIYFRTSAPGSSGTADNALANRMVLYGSGGLVIGSPTGTNKGAGTLNAQAVYDDNVLLTDYVFDKYFDGEVRVEDQPLHGDYNMLTMDQMSQYIETNRHLPTIPGRDEWEANGKFSLGKLVNHLWETAETHGIYVKELNDANKNQELRIASQEEGLLAQNTRLTVGENEIENGKLRMDNLEGRVTELENSSSSLSSSSSSSSENETNIDTNSNTNSAYIQDENNTNSSDKVTRYTLHVTSDSWSDFTDDIVTIFKELIVTAKTTFGKAVSFLGEVEFWNEAEFNEKAVFNKEVVLNKDQVGQAEIKAGEIKTEIEFEKEYSSKPIVTITPRGKAALKSEFKYAVTEEKETGFIIEINEVQEEDVQFNWHAFGASNPKLITNEESVIPTEAPLDGASGGNPLEENDLKQNDSTTSESDSLEGSFAEFTPSDDGARDDTLISNFDIASTNGNINSNGNLNQNNNSNENINTNSNGNANANVYANANDNTENSSSENGNLNINLNDNIDS